MLESDYLIKESFWKKIKTATDSSSVSATLEVILQF